MTGVGGAEAGWASVPLHPAPDTAGDVHLFRLIFLWAFKRPDLAHWDPMGAEFAELPP